MIETLTRAIKNVERRPNVRTKTTREVHF